jgi:hypothetical protein
MLTYGCAIREHRTHFKKRLAMTIPHFYFPLNDPPSISLKENPENAMRLFAAKVRPFEQKIGQLEQQLRELNERQYSAFGDILEEEIHTCVCDLDKQRLGDLDEELQNKANRWIREIDKKNPLDQKAREFLSKQPEKWGATGDLPKRPYPCEEFNYPDPDTSIWEECCSCKDEKDPKVVDQMFIEEIGGDMIRPNCYVLKIARGRFRPYVRSSDSLTWIRGYWTDRRLYISLSEEEMEAFYRQFIKRSCCTIL